ncbi:MAG: zinc ABC transporter substrate-binding protein [Candidatus Zixiibacteriota bacterium]
MKRILNKCKVIWRWLFPVVVGVTTFFINYEVQAQTNNKIQAFVSILPQKYFVERIGGEFIEVSVLVGPGQSPATFNATPKQIAALSKSDLLFTIGVPFEERLLTKATKLFPNIKIIKTQNGIKLRRMDDHSHDHDLDEEDSHQHGAYDPHIWLNPQLVKRQGENICSALIEIYPQQKPYFESNLKSFQTELDSLDLQIGKLLSEYVGRGLLVFHPSFGYFTDRYGLRQIAVQVEGKEPGGKRLAELIDFAGKEKVDAIIVQEQFSQRTAQSIADEIGCDVISLDPLAEDYLNNMKAMAKAIKKALSK